MKTLTWRHLTINNLLYLEPYISKCFEVKGHDVDSSLFETLYCTLLDYTKPQINTKLDDKPCIELQEKIDEYIKAYTEMKENDFKIWDYNILTKKEIQTQIQMLKNEKNELYEKLVRHHKKQHKYNISRKALEDNISHIYWIETDICPM